jgi:hypothetical protein
LPSISFLFLVCVSPGGNISRVQIASASCVVARSSFEF